MSRGWRGLSLALLLLASSAAAFVWRTWSLGQAELAASDAALALGEHELALFHARQAAGAFVPGAAHVTRARARLQAIALDAEREGHGERAASAWQALRAAALQSAHFSQPAEPQLALANAHLAQLRGFASAAAAGLEQRPPASAPRALLGLGFLSAAGGLCWFASCAWSESGRWQLARAVWPALCWCIGALVMGWALLHA